jgi:predicted ribosome-associated RNA-binding protein Tma20
MHYEPIPGVGEGELEVPGPLLTSISLSLSSSPDHIQVFVVGGAPLFFCQRDGPWFPTLRLLHQYPDMMPKLRADKGAIKFVLSGAHIMCPGLTSPGATIEAEVRRNEGENWGLPAHTASISLTTTF